jgi:hypothetical protein
MIFALFWLARHHFSIFGWAQTEKFEDLFMNLLFFLRFSKFLGEPVTSRPVFWLRHCQAFFGSKREIQRQRVQALYLDKISENREVLLQSER